MNLDAVDVVKLYHDQELSVSVVWVLEDFFNGDCFPSSLVDCFVDYSESSLADDFDPIITFLVTLFLYLPLWKTLRVPRLRVSGVEKLLVLEQVRVYELLLAVHHLNGFLIFQRQTNFYHYSANLKRGNNWGY